MLCAHECGCLVSCTAKTEEGSPNNNVHSSLAGADQLQLMKHSATDHGLLGRVCMAGRDELKFALATKHGHLATLAHSWVI